MRLTGKSAKNIACKLLKSAGMSRLCTIEDALYISVSGAVWASHIWISRHCACRSRAASLPFVLLMWPDSCNKTTATCQLYNKEAFNGMTTFVSTCEMDNIMLFFFFCFFFLAHNVATRCWGKTGSSLEINIESFPPCFVAYLSPQWHTVASSVFSVKTTLHYSKYHKSALPVPLSGQVLSFHFHFIKK